MRLIEAPKMAVDRSAVRSVRISDLMMAQIDRREWQRLKAAIFEAARREGCTIETRYSAEGRYTEITAYPKEDTMTDSTPTQYPLADPPDRALDPPERPEREPREYADPEDLGEER